MQLSILYYIFKELLTLTGIFGQAAAPLQTGQAIISVDITVFAKGTSTTSRLNQLRKCIGACAYKIECFELRVILWLTE